MANSSPPIESSAMALLSDMSSLDPLPAAMTATHDEPPHRNKDASSESTTGLLADTSANFTDSDSDAVVPSAATNGSAIDGDSSDDDSSDGDSSDVESVAVVPDAAPTIELNDFAASPASNSKEAAPATAISPSRTPSDSSAGASDSRDSSSDANGSSKLSRRQRLRQLQYEYRNYISQSAREVRRNKMQFALGCTSIFLVVVIVSVSISTLQYSPVLFLGLAESQSGEIDLSISATSRTGFSGLNYTLISSFLSDHGDASMQYHTPRHTFEADVYSGKDCAPWNASDPTDSQWTYKTPQDVGRPADYLVRCSNAYSECLSYNCDYPQAGVFYLIDSEKEKEIGLGRSWEYPKVPKGSCYVQNNLARSLDVGVGDYIYVSVKLNDEEAASFYMVSAGYNFTVRTNSTYLANIPLRVDAIIPSTTNKWSASVRNVVMIELEDFPSLLSLALSSSDPQITPPFRSAIASVPPHSGVSTVLLNLPSPRFDFYRSTTFATNARSVVAWSSDTLFLLGFDQVDAILPCLRELQATNFASAFLGLMLNIVIILLTLISTLLIYSLLMISVEARTFELGIYRMVGMRRAGLLQMILVHAWMFAVPAWVLGLVIAQIVFAVVANALSNLSSLSVAPLLSSLGVEIATLLGLVIPLIAAILPIKAALGKNLHDALDSSRSKTKAVEITVSRATVDQHSFIFFTTGILLTAFGFMIYYFLPLALLGGDVTSLFNIFLVIIMSMMIGLVILALNFQPLLEQLLIKVWFLVFFFENPSIPGIVGKNLVAHRRRNRKTAITYSTALAFIIFLAVAVDVELRTVQYDAYISTGSALRVTAWDFDSDGLPKGIASMAVLEEWAEAHPYVQDFSWVSYHLRDTWPLRTATEIETLGQYTSSSQNIYGATPNVVDTLLSMFYSPGEVDDASPYSISEQLYTPKGSRGSLLGANFIADMDITSLESRFQVTVTSNTRPLQRVTRTIMSPISLVRGIALFSMSYFSDSSNDMVVSLPTLVDLSEGQFMSVMDLPMRFMLLKTPDGITDDEMDELIRSMPSLSVGFVDDARDDFSAFVGQSETIKWVFQIVTIFTMIIAFFSLNTSMYTNIVEQSKEIGILRALGLTRGAIFRIYTYEALFLVLSSAFLGSCIGLLIGWSISAQRALFTQVPISFSYPWDLVITVSIVAIICALISTATPVARLVMRPVIGTLRS